MRVCVCVRVRLTLHDDLYCLCHGGPQGVGGVAAVPAFVQVERRVVIGSQRPGSFTLRPELLAVLHPAVSAEREEEVSQRRTNRKCDEITIK